MIAIINYDMGNVTSVLNGLKMIDVEAEITDSPTKIKNADKLILPGVGAFQDGISNIHKKKLDDILSEAVLINKKPILGICLGMQLMCSESFEFGHYEGLNWIEASVRPLQEKMSLRVPHMGWNDIYFPKDSPVFKDITLKDFYFVHSYYVDCVDTENVIAKCNYGIDFCCAFQKSNVFGVQFHPEKSQLAGLSLLRNFANL